MKLLLPIVLVQIAIVGGIIYFYLRHKRRDIEIVPGQNTWEVDKIFPNGGYIQSDSGDYVFRFEKEGKMALRKSGQEIWSLVSPDRRDNYAILTQTGGVLFYPSRKQILLLGKSIEGTTALKLSLENTGKLRLNGIHVDQSIN